MTLKKKPSLDRILMLSLLALGVGIRVLDITDAPLDFHAWRQLRSATIARGMYYQMASGVDPDLRQLAENLGRQFETLEPPIFERIVAITYLAVGEEIIWISRLYTTLFWVIGGVALYGLSHRVISRAGATLSLALYAVLPFGVIGGRSFQPDPLMVMWMILATYSLFRWSEDGRWRWALAAGIAGGLASLVKIFAALPIAAVAISSVTRRPGLVRAAKSPQSWIVAALMTSLPAGYYVLSIGVESSRYISNFVLGFSDLILDPFFYLRWGAMLHRLFGVPVILAAMLGTFLMPRPGRWLVIGLWTGFFLIGLAVPSLIITHSYYSLPLVPIVSLSLAPFGERLLAVLGRVDPPWNLVGAVIALISIGYPVGLVVEELLAEDYRLEPVIWERIGEELPKDGPIIGLTHDYNTRLKYYGWTGIGQWPHSTDFQMGVLAGGNYDPSDPALVGMIEEKTAGYRYFVVTLFTELEQQPILQDVLYANYPYSEGDGHVLFDLAGID